jgi:hypothetical protein
MVFDLVESLLAWWEHECVPPNALAQNQQTHSFLHKYYILRNASRCDKK